VNPRPAPINDPYKVWLLLQGMPRYHVPRFQITDATNTANTNDAPTPLGNVMISFNGTSFRTPIATVTPPNITPRKLNVPDQGTATIGFNAFV